MTYTDISGLTDVATQRLVKHDNGFILMDLIQKLTYDACSGGVRLKNSFITLCARHAPLRPQRDPPEMSHTVDDLRACSFSEIRRPSLFPLATGHFSRLPVQVPHLYRIP
jgi:hypothetical protein